jgi:hypothetical protein
VEAETPQVMWDESTKGRVCWHIFLGLSQPNRAQQGQSPIGQPNRVKPNRVPNRVSPIGSDLLILYNRNWSGMIKHKGNSGCS